MIITMVATNGNEDGDGGGDVIEWLLLRPHHASARYLQVVCGPEAPPRWQSRFRLKRRGDWSLRLGALGDSFGELRLQG